MHRKPTTISSTTAQASNHHNHNKKPKPKSLDQRPKSLKYEIKERDELMYQKIQTNAQKTHNHKLYHSPSLKPPQPQQKTQTQILKSEAQITKIRN